MAQRGLSSQDVEYVVCFGQVIETAGAIHCFLSRRSIPKPDRRLDRYKRLEGTTVLLAPEQTSQVITVYRNRLGAKDIRTKTKYDYRS
jgi:hypothetical protein